MLVLQKEKLLLQRQSKETARGCQRTEVFKGLATDAISRTAVL